MCVGRCCDFGLKSNWRTDIKFTQNKQGENINNLKAFFMEYTLFSKLRLVTVGWRKRRGCFFVEKNLNAFNRNNTTATQDMEKVK